MDFHEHSLVIRFNDTKPKSHYSHFPRLCWRHATLTQKNKAFDDKKSKKTKGSSKEVRFFLPVTVPFAQCDAALEE